MLFSPVSLRFRARLQRADLSCSLAFRPSFASFVLSNAYSRSFSSSSSSLLRSHCSSSLHASSCTSFMFRTQLSSPTFFSSPCSSYRFFAIHNTVNQMDNHLPYAPKEDKKCTNSPFDARNAEKSSFGLQNGTCLDGKPSSQSCTKNEEEENRAAQKEMVLKILMELRVTLKSRHPIGAVFRLLSKDHQKALAKMKIPLETLLLHFPHHFCTFRSKIARNTGPIQVCPYYQAPSTVRPLVLPESGKVPLLVEIALEEKNGYGRSSKRDTLEKCQTESGLHRSPSDHDDVCDDIPLTKKQQLQYILSNIPETFVSFVNLRVPQKVKEEYMGYPSIKPKEFFLRYPHLFEVRDGEGPHTFYVRRKTSTVL